MATKNLDFKGIIRKLVGKKKIVVTGSSGFLGKNVMRLLPEAIPWDHSNGRDIFSPEFMEMTKDADVIIHLAAQVSVPASFENPEFTYHLNVKGTLQVLLAAEQNKAKLIFPSSAAVYKYLGRNSIRETDELESLNPYGKSKIEAEYLCAAFRDHFPIVTLRIFNMYGFNPLPQDDSVINQFINGVKEGEIVINGDGTQMRDFISVKDVAKIIVDAVSNPAWDGQIVNVGTGVGISMNQLAELFQVKEKVKVTHRDTTMGVRSAIADTLFLRSLYKEPLVTNLAKDLEKNL